MFGFNSGFYAKLANMVIDSVSVRIVISRGISISHRMLVCIGISISIVIISN